MELSWMETIAIFASSMLLAYALGLPINEKTFLLIGWTGFAAEVLMQKKARA